MNLGDQDTNEQSTSHHANGNKVASDVTSVAKKGMVLQFTPYAMSFDKMSYFVDMPYVSSFL